MFPQQHVHHLAMLVDGVIQVLLLLFADGSGAVRSFVLPIAEFIALVRRSLTRSWTLGECRRFLHQAPCPA